MHGIYSRAVTWLLGLATAGLVSVAALASPDVPSAAGGQERDAPPRPFSVVAKRYAFSPDRLEVQENDLVKITFTAEDIAHSFTIDDYRIAKRAGAGRTVTFEFRADRVGSFRFYCNLAIDEGCRKMSGVLVVRPR